MRLLVIGGGNGLLQIRDALDSIYQQTDKLPIVVMDDRPLNQENYLGKIDASEAKRWLDENKYNAAIISISTSIEARERAFNEFRDRGIQFVSVVHKSAYRSPHAEIGVGNVILSNCHLGTHARIGDNNFISTGCNIEHHNEVGSHCTFGPSVVTSSRCKIGDRVRFGTGIFMEPGVEIGDDCIIGSGTILTMNTKVLPKHIIKTKISSLPQEIK